MAKVTAVSFPPFDPLKQFRFLRLNVKVFSFKISHSKPSSPIRDWEEKRKSKKRDQMVRESIFSLDMFR
jgi:hypothetical protein